MCVTKEVVCWHCGEEFEKDSYRDGMSDDFEACPHCGKGFEDLGTEAQIAVRRTLRPIFEEIRRKEEFVLWQRGDESVVWRPQRTPKLGWTTLTLLEAKADSASVHLEMGNEQDAAEQLNDVLQILRARIEEEKERTDQSLLQTCEYRETQKTRCNRYPTELAPDGRHLCSRHMEEADQAQATLPDGGESRGQ